MLKYYSTALALKLFSFPYIGPIAYRAIGNTLGQKLRMKRGLEKRYLDRARFIIDILNNKISLPTNAKTLEIGTGWVHWESTMLKLFFDVRPTAVDVWDNRQFIVFKYYMEQLGKNLSLFSELDAANIDRVKTLIFKLSKTSSFEEVYKELDLTYIIDTSGNLELIKNNKYDLIVSVDVLEHVSREIAPKLVQRFSDLLNVGGYCVHIIDIRDHLSYYDTSVPYKQYLKYSDDMWMALFENKIQYINRIQKPEWIDMFAKTNLELLHIDAEHVDISDMKIAPQYYNMSQEDLGCHLMQVIYQKTIDSPPADSATKTLS